MLGVDATNVSGLFSSEALTACELRARFVRATGLETARAFRVRVSPAPWTKEKERPWTEVPGFEQATVGMWSVGNIDAAEDVTASCPQGP